MTEWILPFEQSWNYAHADASKDVAHGVVYEIANIIAILQLPLVSMLVPWRSIWPLHLPIGVQLLLAIIIADFSLTMIHYLSHRINWLWRLHSVHHGVHRLYSFNGWCGTLHRCLILPAQHRLDVACRSKWPFCLPRNFRKLWYSTPTSTTRSGPFKNLAVGPVHRFHHVNWAGQGDVNFGLFLTCWDRLLGTLTLSAERAPRAGDIGIQDSPGFPQHYLTQLVLPFAIYRADTASEQPAGPISAQQT